MTPAPEQLREDILEAATDWFARLRSGTMTEAEGGDFQRWLEADAAHREAFERAEQMWAGVGLEAIRSHPRVLALRERGLAGGARRRWRMAAIPAAIAACLALAVLGGPVLMRLEPRGAAPVIKQEFRTSVGQKATVKLPDGSLVTLDTDTVLRTRETPERRFVTLERGQAFFKVAKDPTRPFVVTAAGRTVTALGTAFSVKVQDRKFEVVLVEGVVRVEEPVRASPLRLPTGRVQATEMQPGSQLVSRGDRQWSVREVDENRETAWLRGRLVYQARPLAEVVADINRYSEKKIVIDDDVLASKALSGTYRAGDVAGFVQALQDYGLARVSKETDERIELAAF